MVRPSIMFHSVNRSLWRMTLCPLLTGHALSKRVHSIGLYGHHWCSCESGCCLNKFHYWFYNKIKIYFKSHLEMSSVFLIFIASSLADKKIGFLAPKPTPSGECLETLEYCKIFLIERLWLVHLVLEMCGSLPKDLPFCNPDSPEWEGHDCMTCIVECYGETVGQGTRSFLTEALETTGKVNSYRWPI